MIAVGVAISTALSPFPSKSADLVTGGGGFPLTPAVTSMWGMVDEPVAPGKKRLTFMIYFRGTDGWHQRKWSSNQQLKDDPFVIEFASDLTTLRAVVDRRARTLTVFGSHCDLSKGNVLLIENVDHPGHEVVVTLGYVELVVPEEANPAIWLLQNDEAIRAKVIKQ